MFGSQGNLFHTHHGNLVSRILVGIKGVLVFTPQGVWVQTVRYLIGMMKSAPIDNGHLTGKSFSEALILESINPQYDERLFIEFPENMLCTNIVLNVKTKTKNNFCTEHVVNLYFSGNSMNNLLSYCR